ncbi:MAG: LacI family DNA-binding transcriptional regulator [Pseudomonadota bacterium]
MPTRPTSRDIAEAAGVSQATVSRALRNSALVRPETRKRIMRIARQMNYRVNRQAAGLRSQQSRTLALLLFDEGPASDASMINPFFLSMLSSITRAAAGVGYDVLVSFQQLSNHWHARYEGSHTADGIILLGYGDYLSYREKLEALVDAQAHFIIWGPIMADQPGHSLGCDNLNGARQAAAHLLSRGRRRVAFLGEASERFPEFRLRHAGYAQVLAEAGLGADPALCIDAESQEDSGYRAAEELLRSGRDFDAVFAASDLIAIGAMRALKEAGRAVPQDVAVVGFDDISAAAYVVPRLTTIRQDTSLAGSRLVENLVALIEGETVESSLLEPELIVRESCGG